MRDLKWRLHPLQVKQSHQLEVRLMTLTLFIFSALLFGDCFQGEFSLFDDSSCDHVALLSAMYSCSSPFFMAFINGYIPMLTDVLYFRCVCCRLNTRV